MLSSAYEYNFCPNEVRLQPMEKNPTRTSNLEYTTLRETLDLEEWFLTKRTISLSSIKTKKEAVIESAATLASRHGRDWRNIFVSRVWGTN